jgi:hypothetical protein
MKRILITAALLLGTIVPGGLMATATPAGAICNPGSFAFGTGSAAEQARYPSTCDGDGFYAGQVADPVTDGLCAVARYRTHGTSGAGWIQGQACTTGAWTNYNAAAGAPFDARVCAGTSTMFCSPWFVHFGF